MHNKEGLPWKEKARWDQQFSLAVSVVGNAKSKVSSAGKWCCRWLPKPAGTLPRLGLRQQRHLSCVANLLMLSLQWKDFCIYASFIRPNWHWCYLYAWIKLSASWHLFSYTYHVILHQGCLATWLSVLFCICCVYMCIYTYETSMARFSEPFQPITSDFVVLLLVCIDKCMCIFMWL